MENEKMEEIEAVRKNLQGSRLKDILLDEMAKNCPGVSYDRLLQAAMTLQKAKRMINAGAPDSDYNELGRQFRQTIGRRSEENRAMIQGMVREQRLSGRLSYSWYYNQPITAWEWDFHYIKLLSDYLMSGMEPERASVQERSYEIFHDDTVLTEYPELLERLGVSMEQLNIVAQPDPLMLAVQCGRQPHGGWCQHFAVETKEAYYGLYPVLNRTRFSTVIYGAGWKLAGNLFQLPYQIGREWYKHRVWYFGNMSYDGICLWYAIKKKLPAGMELKLAVPMYKAMLLYPPVKQAKSGAGGKAPGGQSGDVDIRSVPEPMYSVQAGEAVEAFCREFEPEDAAIWRDILGKNMYYPQSMLGNQELQKLFREMDKGLVQVSGQ